MDLSATLTQAPPSHFGGAGCSGVRIADALAVAVNAVNASNPAALLGPWAIRKRPKPPGRAGLCAFATFVQVLALEVPAAVDEPHGRGHLPHGRPSQ